MARTTMQGFSKLYPHLKFFQNQEIIDEIRPSILILFNGRIEHEIMMEQENNEKMLAPDQNPKAISSSSSFNEGISPVILSK